ncbi:MAG: thioredoxin family protein [Terriglobales bacterium]
MQCGTSRYVANFYVVSLLLLAVPFCVAQGSPGSPENKSFPPLDQWKAAVINHDSAALKELYSSNPPTRIASPKGQLDATSEVAFWTGLNIHHLKIDISQADSPAPDLRRLVFKMEFQSAASPQTLYVSAGEVWQRQGEKWRLIATQRSDAGRLEQPLSVSNDIYQPGSDAHAKIADALATASKEHKRVIIVFGANWCYDCHVLDTAFHRPDLAALLAHNYVVVHVDVGRGDQNQDLMNKYEVPMKKGIPGLAVLDSSGNLLTSQKNGEFENARALGPQDLLAFLNKWVPPAR